MDVIRLKNMVFYGYHGVSDIEKKLGGKFEVDLDLYKDLRIAGKSDKLKDTLDYEKIYKTVYNCTKRNKYYLIEKLADRIANSILAKYPVDKIKVKVRKPQAPVKGVLDTVEVEIVRTAKDCE